MVSNLNVSFGKSSFPDVSAGLHQASVSRVHRTKTVKFAILGRQPQAQSVVGFPHAT